MHAFLHTFSLMCGVCVCPIIYIQPDVWCVCVPNNLHTLRCCLQRWQIKSQFVLCSSPSDTIHQALRSFHGWVPTSPRHSSTTRLCITLREQLIYSRCLCSGIPNCTSIQIHIRVYVHVDISLCVHVRICT